MATCTPTRSQPYTLWFGGAAAIEGGQGKATLVEGSQSTLRVSRQVPTKK